jgi:phospholipase/carboxylesterase
MALESARQGKALAGRIGSIAGRFAQLPDTAPEHCALHFIHGRNDTVIPYAHAVAAAERLTALGAGATVDIVPLAGHEITPAMAALLVERLRGPMPQQPSGLSHSDRQ